MTDSLMTTYARQAITFERGEGVWLWDEDGNKYLDALCGISVTSLGHAHPATTQAVCEQAGRLIHTSNLYNVKQQSLLADKLCQLSGMDRVFFGNSGAEANEAAIKIARLYGHNKGIHKPAIITTENSFHGRTLATLSATGNRKVQAGFEPLVSGFLRVPYNDLDAIKAIAKSNSQVVAILVEPIQGEGGINIPDKTYLGELRKLCDEHGWLLMLDEIQTGMGRSGKWFAFQHDNFLPDVMTLAKALGNGVPIGACLAHGQAADVLQAGNHGSTYGGNPLACRAALATINTIENDKLLSRVTQLGDRISSAIRTGTSANTMVKEVRHKGLLIGITLDRPCAELVKLGIDAGILINVTASNVIRLLPPFILTDEEADLIAEKVVQLISQFN